MEERLLEKVASVEVQGAERFCPKDCLESSNVGWTGDVFKKNFLEKVEEKVEPAVLAVHRLKKDSLDAPILAELGDKAKTKLAYLFELMAKQSKGEKGILLTNGYANIIYVSMPKAIYPGPSTLSGTLAMAIGMSMPSRLRIRTGGMRATRSSLAILETLFF